MNTIQVFLFILLWFGLGCVVGWAVHKINIEDKASSLNRICDARVIKERGFNYLHFDISNEHYSERLEKYPHGADVEVYIRRKHLKR